MRFMIIRKADKNTEAGAMPSTELISAMMSYNEEMAKAGVLVDGTGLKPSSAGKRVRFEGGKPNVIDGPFAETKELIAGFTMIEAPSMEKALDWVKRWPREDGDVVLEVRPVLGMEDFGAAVTDEIKDQEQRIRDTVTGKK